MPADITLSSGAITQILDGNRPANPLLQIIGYKPMNSDATAYGHTTDELRYRLMVGDGSRTYQYCLITNQDLVEDIKSGRLEKWSVVKVSSYQTADVGDGPTENKRRLIYLLNLQIVKRGSEVGHKITNPEPTNNESVGGALNINPYSNNGAANNNQPNREHSGFAPSSNMVTTQAQPYPSGGMANPDMIRSPRTMRNANDHQTIGIAELTPYIGKWIVKGRVTSKSAIREYNNAKGGGKLFNFVIADKSGEVKVTAFNADCERVYPYVEPNKVYVLGKATVKAADKRYTTADHEITLNSDSLLEEVVDSREINEIPLAKFNFISIANTASVAPNQPVDLIGAIQEVTDVQTINSRTKNKELKKRNITIVDMSRYSISVTIWGEASENFIGAEGDVFVTKAARIGTYGGRSASAGDCIFVNPDIPEVRKVKSWYANLLERNFTSLTTTQDSQGSSDQWKTLDQMQSKEAAKIALSSGQPSASYGKCKAVLLNVGKNPVYKCCPTEGCGKKLQETQSGELRCEKCQQTFSSYKYRYKTDVEIADHSSTCWVTLWDEKAEMILKMKPEELERVMKTGSKEAYEKIMTKPNFNQYIFTLRSRIDTYNQEERVKLTVVNMSKMDTITFSKRLISEIKAISC